VQARSSALQRYTPRWTLPLPVGPWLLDEQLVGSKHAFVFGVVTANGIDGVLGRM
jgi:hypothetical protein